MYASKIRRPERGNGGASVSVAIFKNEGLARVFIAGELWLFKKP
jgi:hypothetical protein